MKRQIIIFFFNNFSFYKYKNEWPAMRANLQLLQKALDFGQGKKNIYIFLVWPVGRLIFTRALEFTPLHNPRGSPEYYGQKQTRIHVSNIGYQTVQPAIRAYFQLLRRALAFGQGFFCPSGRKKELFKLFVVILGQFWCSVETYVTLKVTPKISKIENKNKKKIHIYIFVFLKNF